MRQWNVDDASKGIVKLIENMNMKKYNGSFYDWNNEKLSW